MLRSPHAHARIVSIDTAAARAMPGVLLVLTGADVAAEGLKPIPHIPQAQSPPDIRLDNHDGSPHRVEQPPILAIDTVRFVGEAVAFVVADTRGAAPRMPPKRSQVDVRDPAADRRHRRRCAGRRSGGDARGLRRGRTTSCGSRPTSSASTGVPMEPRAALGRYDPATGRYTLHAGGGAIVRPKKEIAIILGVAPEKVRVIAHEVGGNFGTRNSFYPEFALVAWAAKKIGRPVKWTCERHEAFAQRLCRPRLPRRVGAGARSADGKFLGLQRLAAPAILAPTPPPSCR